MDGVSPRCRLASSYRCLRLLNPAAGGRVEENCNRQRSSIIKSANERPSSTTRRRSQSKYGGRLSRGGSGRHSCRRTSTLSEDRTATGRVGPSSAAMSRRSTGSRRDVGTSRGVLSRSSGSTRGTKNSHFMTRPGGKAHTLRLAGSSLLWHVSLTLLGISPRPSANLAIR